MKSYCWQALFGWVLLVFSMFAYYKQWVVAIISFPMAVGIIFFSCIVWVFTKESKSKPKKSKPIKYKPILGETEYHCVFGGEK